MIARTNLVSSRWTLLAAAAMCLAPTACNRTSSPSGSDLPTGSVQLVPGQSAPDEADNQLRFVVADNHGWDGSKMRILSVEYGRIVDLLAPVTGVNGGEPVRIFDDMLIAPDLDPATTDTDFEPLVRDLATGAESLTCKHTFGTPEFDAAFARLTENLQFLIDKSLDPTELPPFTSVPRNGAIAITFDDLLDPATISNDTVQVEIGYPPSAEQVARIVPDLTRGDLLNGAFFSTRVLIDFTISDVEAVPLGVTVNSLGLPEAQNTSQPNVVVRVPTRTAQGVQFDLLANLAGRFVSFTGNGSTDPTAPALDVVRAFRSGGRATITGDLFNGFLPDSTPPRVLSAQQILVQPLLQNGADLVADLTFGTAACAMTPRAGDVVAFQAGTFAEVVADGGPPVSGVAAAVQLLLLDYVDGSSNLGVSAAEYRTPWLSAPDQSSRPECWVALQPPPGTGIGSNISTSTTFTLQFSEPIDPDRFNAFDSFQLLHGFAMPTLQTQVLGALNVSTDLTRFTLQPLFPLKHAAGGTELYRLQLPAGALGPVDLAGNALPVPLRETLPSPLAPRLPEFRVKASEAASDSRSLMLKFASVDEDDPLADPQIPEISGQLILDLQNGRALPRSVQRLSAICDLNTPMAQADVANGGGTATTRLPFVAQGCRLMTLWRHADLGFSLLDDSFHNLDVEGLAWSPVNSGLQIDTFPLFQLSLCHSLRLPEEGVTIPPPPAAPITYPFSSISDTFADNVLDPVRDPLQVVHPKSKGYFVQPIDVFTSATGTVMAPWPLNQDAPIEEYTYYTWRDTSLLSVGQPNVGIGSGVGVKLIFEQGYDPGLPTTPYPLGSVPTIGLPLLMDFRVYPSAQIVGANSLLGLFTHTAATPETPPYFTAYSAGGFNSA